jgi:hypothetical protein|tara:strand:- start:886 stop:1026 length:141 start_codon:yes stop_codon:yes gene_type:complete
VLRKKPTITRDQLEKALKEYKGVITKCTSKKARVYGALNNTTAGKG